MIGSFRRVIPSFTRQMTTLSQRAPSLSQRSMISPVFPRSPGTRSPLSPYPCMHPSISRFFSTHIDPISTGGEAASAAEEIPSPSRLQLRRYAVQCMVPMIGFGFMDNLVMIQVGDLIDTTIGVTFALSTLTAAACGQMCSDFSGVMFGGVVESITDAMGLPSAELSSAQHSLQRVRFVRTISMAIGVVLGCGLGMLSLLTKDLGKAERLKKQQQLATLFDTIMTDGSSFMNCDRCTLQLVEKDMQSMHLWTIGQRVHTEEQLDRSIQNLKDRVRLRRKQTGVTDKFDDFGEFTTGNAQAEGTEAWQ